MPTDDGKTMRARRTAIPILAGAMVLAFAGCTASVPTAATPSPTPTATSQTPTPVPPIEVRVAAASGTIANWDVASPLAVGEVGPAVGFASSGEVAAMVDAPVVASDGVEVLATTAALDAGETYVLSAQVATLTDDLTQGAVKLKIGSTVAASSAMQVGKWEEIEIEFTAPETVADARLAISLHVPARRVVIDDVSLSSTTGAELLANGSFEDVAPSALIANTSLMMSTDYATVAIGAPTGTVSWKVANADDSIAAEGTISAVSSLEAIPLTDVPQGLYTLTVTDAGGRTATTPIGLVDTTGYDIPMDPRFGTTLHLERVGYDAQVRYAGALGLGTVGSDVLWRLNETSRGIYNWDKRYDSEFARTRSSGIELMAIINYGNPLYGNSKVPATDAAIAAYGRYAGAVAERYGPDAIEIFNEFNIKRFNEHGCGLSADCYRPLVTSVSKNVRTVDPDITLIAGATANYESKWFDRLWELRALDDIDAMSFHPYQANSRPDSVTNLVDDAQKVSATHGGDALPIWITETGTSSKTGGRTLADQAAFLIAMESSDLSVGVERVFWYDLKNGSTDPKHHEFNFGLYEFEPRANVAAIPPKPSGYAQALLVASIDGRESTGSVDLADGVIARSFGTPDDQALVIWAPEGPTSVSIPATRPLQVATPDGKTIVIEPQDGVVSLGASYTPVIVRVARAVSAN